MITLQTKERLQSLTLQMVQWAIRRNKMISLGLTWSQRQISWFKTNRSFQGLTDTINQRSLYYQMLLKGQFHPVVLVKRLVESSLHLYQLTRIRIVEPAYWSMRWALWGWRVWGKLLKKRLRETIKTIQDISLNTLTRMLFPKWPILKHSNTKTKKKQIIILIQGKSILICLLKLSTGKRQWPINSWKGYSRKLKKNKKKRRKRSKTLEISYPLLMTPILW